MISTLICVINMYVVQLDKVDEAAAVDADSV